LDICGGLVWACFFRRNDKKIFEFGKYKRSASGKKVKL